MESIAKFLFEAGVLKRVKRSGWWLEGIRDPESVADHSYRTAVIGYILANLEKADTNRVMKMCLFHDIVECRINDVPRSAKGYVDTKNAEAKVIKDQTSPLPADIGKEILGLFTEFNERKSKEAVVARDADILEVLVQAKEYLELGHTGVQYWIDNNRKLLRTESAKSILEEILSSRSTEWWRGMEKMEF